MVIIRLSRFGRKKAPFYRVVAVDSTKKTTGKVREILGFWNPAKEKKEINREALNSWIKKGARLSPSVEKLFR
jgi:small subunit ribosomal protein S16